MTPTEELAGLLKLAAEKSPDKFAYGFSGEREVAMLRGDPISTAIFIESLDEPGWFTLDHMDAIAEACGMEFSVQRFVSGWRWFFWNTSEPPEAMFTRPEEFHPDKRTASLAALCAILRYRYGEGE